MNEEQPPTKDMIQAVEASDRAGSLIAEQVRAIVRGAEDDAERIRVTAQQDAERIVTRAAEAAGRVLARIDALDEPLRVIVDDLRREADRLTAEPGTEYAD